MLITSEKALISTELPNLEHGSNLKAHILVHVLLPTDGFGSH